jgi:HPt (histidine-containing phosphotransfer) domain-containing protein
MTPVLDVSYLRSITDGDPLMEKEFFRLFQRTALKCTERLTASLAKGDSTLWETTAHELKGAAGYLGARRIQQLCQQARETKIEERGPFLRTLQEEMAALEHCMANLRPPQ